MIVRVADIVPQSWKNGGGRTRELLLGPDAAAWRWRISVADIDRDGAFSAFPGVLRWFAVLEGEGVALALDGREVIVRRGDPPLAFDGAAAPMCRLLGGPTRDLNLMLRGARGVLCPARADEAWDEPWPLRGHFDRAALALAWEVPPGWVPPSPDGFWIGVHP